MFKNIRSIRDADRFRSWLYRIALNRIRDFHRKKSVAVFLGIRTELDESVQINPDNHNNPVDKLMEKEFWRQFYLFTDGLSRREREVFTLRFVDYLGIREIAEVLNKSESTIKTYLYRALKKFKENPWLHDLKKREAIHKLF